jgi:predicted RecA/RadA family phage recombinase
VETSVPGKWEAHYERFSGNLDRKVSLDEGDRLTVVYDSRVESGQLQLAIVGPGDEVAVDIPEGESGETTLDAKAEGNFHIQVTGDDTKGEFSLEWTVE